jgi:hypothetical protein
MLAATCGGRAAPSLPGLLNGQIVLTPGFWNSERSLLLIPLYWTDMTRPFAHSPFFANRTVPTAVENSFACMYSASFFWSRLLVASIACSMTSIIAYE